MLLLARRRRVPAPRARRVLALALGAVLLCGLAACGGDDSDSADEPAAVTTDAPADDRLQATIDALPDLSEDTFEQVGVVAEVPDGVLEADPVAENIASFGSEEDGWFILERHAGTAADNNADITARLMAAGFVEGEAYDAEGMPELRVFERSSDAAVVGVYVADVSEDSADGAEFPSRIGYVVPPL